MQILRENNKGVVNKMGNELLKEKLKKTNRQRELDYNKQLLEEKKQQLKLQLESVKRLKQHIKMLEKEI